MRVGRRHEMRAEDRTHLVAKATPVVFVLEVVVQFIGLVKMLVELCDELVNGAPGDARRACARFKVLDEGRVGDEGRVAVRERTTNVARSVRG